MFEYTTCHLLCSHFSHSVMVSVDVSVLAVTGLHFVNPGIVENITGNAPFPKTLPFNRAARERRTIFRLKHQL